MERARKGFTLIELLIVVVIIGLLAAIAIPKFASTKGQAAMSKMKGDLRNLATAQEAYYGDANTFYIGAIPSTSLVYNPSEGVVITIDHADGAGWGATATYPTLTPRSCALFTGPTPVAPATVEGQITCTN